jgi:hypothetical protein
MSKDKIEGTVSRQGQGSSATDFLPVAVRGRKSRVTCMTLLGLLLWLPVAAHGFFNYVAQNGEVTILGYNGEGGDVSIPETITGYPVTRINGGAFRNNTTLTSVAIPDSVTSIGDQAFQSCSALTTMTIPNSVTNIGASAFASCTSLNSLVIGSGVASIGADACFNTRNLPAIEVSTENASYSSFDGILYDKAQTTLLQCPAGKTGTALLPSTLTIITTGAFRLTQHLTSLEVAADNPFYSSSDGVLFDKSKETLMLYPQGRAGDYVIPDGVEHLAAYAFRDCQLLTGVFIPDSVQHIGHWAFHTCFNLASVRMSNQVRSIGGSAFAVCSWLTSITLPDTITELGPYAFWTCIRLTSVTVPAGVSNLLHSTFANCWELTGVYFKGNAPFVEQNLFAGSDEVTVYFLPGTTGWESSYGGRPTKLWNPEVPSTGSGFGGAGGEFGFTITGTEGLAVVVEAASSLIDPEWTVVSTNILTGGSTPFNDPHSTGKPVRFYRLRSP